MILAENVTEVTGNLASYFSSLKLGFLTDTVYMHNTLLQYLLFAAIFVMSFVVGKVVYYLLKNRLSEIAKKSENRLDDILINILQGPLVLAIIIIGVSYGLQVLSMPADFATFLNDVLSIIVSLTILWFVMRLADSLIEEYMHPYAAKTESELDDQLIPLLKKVIKFLIIVFGLISIISNFGYDITALITGLGIGGIAIALAAQETLSNMFGGIAIFMDRPFAVGDRIKMGEVYGDVVDVGNWSTKIKNLDNNIVIIPNSIISKSIVENYVKPSRKIKQKFTMGLTYGTKPGQMEKAVEIIKKAISTSVGVTKDEPLVYFTDFADFSLNLMCIYWIKSLDYWGTSKHELNMKILKEFEKTGIEIAFPTQTVHLEK